MQALLAQEDASGLFNDSGAALGWPRGPSVVVLNSGAHDLGNASGFTLDSYEKHLRQMWALIRRSAPDSAAASGSASGVASSPPHCKNATRGTTQTLVLSYAHTAI